ncbi:MAG: glycosyltransferase [Roseinatronobacter sp.]
MASRDVFDAVVIGRNEALRLGAALEAVMAKARRTIYVDSGSRDDSVALARALGVEVLELDPSRPFSAARARNEGFAALGRDRARFVQFIDGDCIVQPDWLEVALDFMSAHPEAGLVFGRQYEARPDASVYNFLTDWEWDKPLGAHAFCAGCVMMRSAALLQIGGYDDALIAGEDDDMCMRLHREGWQTWRIAAVMTEHDARLLTIGPWWRRTVRAGYSYGALGRKHGGVARTQRARAILWGGVVPVLALCGLIFWSPLFVGLVVLVGLWVARQTWRFTRLGLDADRALVVAATLLLGKAAELQGLTLFWWRRLRGARTGLIEYK